MKHVSILLNLPFLCVAVLCMGAMEGCKTPVKPDADATKGGLKNPVPENIESVRTNAAAAIAAAEKRSAVKEQVAANAAASVDASQRANLNQPPSPVSMFVDRELGVALKLLPPPDATTALDVEKRRSAVIEGRVAEANALYAKAATEAERHKAEASRLKGEADAAKSKHDAAVSALVAADKKYEAQLAANEAKNQEKLDAAEARAKKAKDDLLEAERRKDVLWLRLAAMGLLLAGIGIGVVTNGLQLGKSIGFGVGSMICFGLAQVVGHPMFFKVSLACIVVAVAAGIWWLLSERKSALAVDGYAKTIAALDNNGLIHDPDGNKTPLAVELGDALDTPHKRLVESLQRAAAVTKAKAAVTKAKKSHV